MTTPLSWVGSSLFRYGGSNEHIGFDWGNHTITIANTRVESGDTVSYKEIVLGNTTEGEGLEIIGENDDSFTSIYTESGMLQSIFQLMYLRSL